MISRYKEIVPKGVETISTGLESVSRYMDSVSTIMDFVSTGMETRYPCRSDHDWVGLLCLQVETLQREPLQAF